MKVVINDDFGGFSLSEKAIEMYLKLVGEVKDFYDRDIRRNDENLIKVVENLGEEANGAYASLKIVEIPDGTKYEICEYDGVEHIAEEHQKWY